MVGSVKSFGGQVKVESMMCTNIHLHTYTHAYVHTCIHATLPACERGLQHSADSRPHQHPFALRDKTTPMRTNQMNYWRSSMVSLRKLNADAKKLRSSY